MPLTAWSVRSPSARPAITGSPRDRAMGSRVRQASARTRDPSHADRNTSVRSELFKIFSERSVVSPARSGSPVEVLLVGHSLDGGVRVGVVEGGECLVSSDGQLERST